MAGTLRFPAEWEPQSAILIAWPHPGTDWADRLEAVESSYVALVVAIIWEYYQANPVLDVRLFKARNFSVACICASS